MVGACLHKHLHNHTDGFPAHDHFHEHETLYCELPTWEDFTFHWTVAFGSWMGLTFLGFMLGACRGSWDAERIERRLRGLVNTFTGDWMYLSFAGLLSGVLCLIHMLRQEVGDEFGNLGEIWNSVQQYICIAFAVETFILFLHSAAKSNRELITLVKSRLHIDCFVAASGLLLAFYEQQASGFTLVYISSLRALNYWRLFKSTFSVRKRGIFMQMFDDFLALVCGIFCLSSAMNQVENLRGTQWPWALNADGRWADTEEPWATWTISAALYFTMGSITTVGYGDLRPRSFFSQGVNIVVLLWGFVILVRCLLGLGEAIEISRVGGAGYERSRKSKHLVVVGTPSYVVLCDFIQELFHEDHEVEAADLTCVIMLTRDQRQVMDAFKRYLKLPANARVRHKVTLIQGSALYHHDLDRILYGEAAMGFVLPNLQAQDAENEDVGNAMRVVSLRRHTPYVRVVAMLLKEEYRDIMRSAGLSNGDIIAADALKQGLLGKSCEVQGFATLACILLKNASMPEEMSFSKDKPIWMDDYCEGLANELYEVDLAKPYWGAPYCEVSLDILQRSNGAAFMVGVVEEPLYPGDEMITRMFPGRDYRVGFVRNRFHKGIFIATDREAVVQIPLNQHFKWSIDVKSGRKLIEFSGEAAKTGSFASATKEKDLKAAMRDEEMEEQAKEAGMAEAIPGIVRPPRPETDVLLAASGRPGWVMNARDIADSHSSKIALKMHSRATRRASEGLRRDADMTKHEADELVGMNSMDVGKMSREQQEAFMEDIRVQEAAENEKKKVLAAASEHTLTLAACGELVKLSEKREQEIREEKQLSWQDAEEDNTLWGGPPDKAREIWSKPMEPPSSMLVRGNHIVVMAIETESYSTSSSAPADKKDKDLTRPGRKLALQHMLNALRANSRKGSFAYAHEVRPVVVMADQVPSDWPLIQKEEIEVYIVVGPILSLASARRAGIQQAHAIVIHQRGPVSSVRSQADAEATFACRFVEMMMKSVGREIPIIVDLNLESSAFYVPLEIESVTAEQKAHRLADTEEEEEEEDPGEAELNTEGMNLPFYLQPRYICGQMTISSAPTFLLANMMYNPALGSIIQELVNSACVMVPVPNDHTVRTYSQLFAMTMKKRNLLPLALLRRLDHDDDDLSDDEEDHAKKVHPHPHPHPHHPHAHAHAAVQALPGQVPGQVPGMPQTGQPGVPPQPVVRGNPAEHAIMAALADLPPQGDPGVPAPRLPPPPMTVHAASQPMANGTHAVLGVSIQGTPIPTGGSNAHSLHGRWTPEGSSSSRYIFAMPNGDRRISPADAILCMKPTVEPPKRPPEALPSMSKKAREGRASSKMSVMTEDTTRTGSKI